MSILGWGKKLVYGDAGEVDPGNVYDPMQRRQADGSYAGDERFAGAQQATGGLAGLYAGMYGSQQPRQSPTTRVAGLDYGRVNAALDQAQGAQRAQEQHLQGLYAASLGLGGPSAAERQYQQGLQQAAAGQMTAANTARGTAQERMAARGAAIDANAMAAAQGRQDLAQLQAQEQAVARDMYAQGVTRYRDQAQQVADMERILGQSQADIAQQAALGDATRALESRAYDDQAADASRDLYASSLEQYLADQGRYLDLGVDREGQLVERGLGIAKANTEADAQQTGGVLNLAGQVVGGLVPFVGRRR